MGNNWENNQDRWARGRGGGGDSRGGGRGRGFGERGGGSWRGDRGGPRPSSSGDFERGRSGHGGDFNRQDHRESSYRGRPDARGGPGAGPSRTPTPTSSRTGAADLGSDFGDMGAAAKNYAKAAPKFPAGMGGGGGPGGGGVPKVEDHNQYRKENCLVVYDSASQGVAGVPEPFKRFSDFPGLSKTQLDCFSRAGFEAPTPIQAQSWPVALSERDVISIAKTGSGKTLAFLLPAYRKMDERQVNIKDRSAWRLIMKAPQVRGRVSVLVLAPTRELATQIQEEADRSFKRFLSSCYLFLLDGDLQRATYLLALMEELLKGNN